MAVIVQTFTSYPSTAGVATQILTLPSGTIDGDLLVAFLSRRSGSTITAVPSGWSNALSSATSYVYYKVASGEPANWTWTWNNTTGDQTGAVVRLNQYDPNSIINASSSTGSGTGSTTCSGFTTSVSSLLLYYIQHNGTSGTVSNYNCANNPIWVELYDSANSALAYGNYVTPGNTGNFTISGPTGGNSFTINIVAISTNNTFTGTDTVHMPGNVTIDRTLNFTITDTIIVDDVQSTIDSLVYTNLNKNNSTWTNLSK